ncbi:hypothetical protein [Microcoleus anatoxicus]|uniref:Uncharacterized protein n=1 Tax=Microcoleus anatoxicus PTRS2 TaxID=2705321 RepID=A0ABU8YR28_9CYAN
MLRTKLKRVSLSGGIVASVLCLVSPVQALQVQVTPANPELGDTLSVINRGVWVNFCKQLQPRLEQDLSAKSKSPVMDKCRS